MGSIVQNNSFTINENNFLDNLTWSEVSYDGDNMHIRMGEKVVSYIYCALTSFVRSEDLTFHFN